MKGILKLPLIVAAVFIALRIITEQMGAPDSVNNAISVVALYMLIFPIYFGVRVARGDFASPYFTGLKLTVLYAFVCRLMIAPTYWMAYVLDWKDVPRFTVEGGGVVGGGVPRAIITPFVLVVMWTVGAAVVGGILTSLTILISRKKPASSPA
jgi:hypothetical protein